LQIADLALPGVRARAKRVRSEIYARLGLGMDRKSTLVSDLGIGAGERANEWSIVTVMKVNANDAVNSRDSLRNFS